MLDNLDTLIGFALIFTVVSLLVTIVVQMITSTLNLRGKNLSWAVAETFEAIDPNLVAKSKGLGKKIANYVLRDPLLSDKQIFNFVGPATAVRSEELFDLLHRIASGQKTGVPEDIKTGIVSLLGKLGITATPSASAQDGVALTPALPNPVISTLEAAVNALPAGAQKDQAIAALKRATADLATIAGRIADDAQVELTAGYQKFETWLETGQERAQEWFALHAKGVTFLVGLVFALVLQLDTIEIFKEVSNNRTLRNQLVARSSVLLGQAEKMLDPSKQGLSAAFKTWQSSLDAGPIKTALTRANVNVEADDTRDSLRRKVEATLAKLDETSTDKIATKTALLKLDATVDAQARADLKNESANYKIVKGDLDDAGFALFPAGDGRWQKNGWLTQDVWRAHGLGMLFSVLLLSLGAPFWFNVLKSLSSLRSTVASNIDAEDKADAKNGSDRTAGSPPPTVTAASDSSSV